MQPDPDALARIGRRGAVRDAYLNMLSEADARGVVVLRGGVRGWAELFGCSPAYPKSILRTLEDEEIATVDVLGDGLAEVTFLCCRSTTDRAPATAVAAEGAAEPAPHSDAASDRSLIDPPQTPHEESHESYMQQQQNLRAHARELQPEPVIEPTEYPQIEPALIRHLVVTLELDLGVTRAMLRGRPAAQLAEWHEDLAAAEANPHRYSPLGTVIHAWRSGRRVGKVRPVQKAAAVATAPAVTPREEFRRRREAGAIDVAGAQRWLEQQGLATPRPPEPPPPSPRPAPAPAPSELVQAWHMALATLRQDLGRQEVDVWLHGVTPVAIEAGVAVVAAGPQLAEGLRGRLEAPLRRALSNALCQPVQLRVVVRGAA